jgi:hypothetical protein
MTDTGKDGFEYKSPDDTAATFYTWSVSTGAKDLMLIDRFTGMPVSEFFEQIEDSFDRGRAPILFALMATSIRAKNPEWSLERIVRLVQNLDLTEVKFIDGDATEDELPPPSGGQQGPPSEDGSTSPSDESKPSATRRARSA